ncbi:hypothetical protein ABZ953_14775 [Streptomyces sp. NPDC046465]|uniref:hypothetical protein n=1 Tax=Streptomyces sp. NPDC046465 TaxID=3155810 RepID=UPI0033F23910
MSTTRPRTLLRTAAVSTLVGGALLVPAAGAFADSPAPEPTASRGQSGNGTNHGKTVAPKGGVKAGAEHLRDAGDPAFLVAGGGMAAAGAAGLGFAMLRRGRTDS